MTTRTPFLSTKYGAYYHREIPTRVRQRQSPGIRAGGPNVFTPNKFFAAFRT